MLVSVLAPVFNEEESLETLCREIVDALQDQAFDFEILLIDDGSTDTSAQVMDGLAAADDRIKVVHLRRNYGQTAAIMAGMHSCAGDVIVPIDADLQNDPADIPRMVGKILDGHDVVSGWRKNRQDKAATRRFPSMVANALIARLFGIDIHDFGCTLKAYRRELIIDVRLYGEMHRYIPIYAAWEGASVTEMVVNHRPRRFGSSKYGMARIVRVLLDIVVLYFLDRALDRPIQFFGKLGLANLFLASCAAVWAVWMKIEGIRDFVESPLPTLMAGFGLAGVMFLLLGVLAEIQSRIYFETRGGVRYRIRATRNLGDGRAPFPQGGPPA